MQIAADYKHQNVDIVPMFNFNVITFVVFYLKNKLLSYDRRLLYTPCFIK